MSISRVMVMSTAVCFALLNLSMPKAADGGSGSEACIKVLDDLEWCQSCPGFSSCLCLYPGAACPGSQVTCRTRNKLEVGGLYGIITNFAPCYTTIPCASLYGGLCHPATNPCVTYGEPTVIAAVRYEQDTEFCDIGEP